MEKGRLVKVGTVVGDMMDKTVVVTVESRKPHPLYKKIVKRKVKFKAHDEGNDCKAGDKVRIQQTRPLSKTKRWKVVEILNQGAIFEELIEEVREEAQVETTTAKSLPEIEQTETVSEEISEEVQVTMQTKSDVAEPETMAGMEQAETLSEEVTQEPPPVEEQENDSTPNEA